MEYLNNFIITLVATMIFMTAIEIIAPDSIDSLEVGVRENGIRLVDKIRINVNDESEEAVSNNEKIDNEEEIKNYLSELFKIPIEKIKLYSMGG